MRRQKLPSKRNENALTWIPVQEAWSHPLLASMRQVEQVKKQQSSSAIRTQTRRPEIRNQSHLTAIFFILASDHIAHPPIRVQAPIFSGAKCPGREVDTLHYSAEMNSQNPESTKKKIVSAYIFEGRDSVVATGWMAGYPVPVEVRFSAPVQTDPGVHPASYVMSTGSLSRA
jgi:hypothetical protein